MLKKTKFTELQNKIPDVSSLATKTALTAVENKIPDSSLVKKQIMNKELVIIIITNIELLQSLIIYLLMFSLQD